MSEMKGVRPQAWRLAVLMSVLLCFDAGGTSIAQESQSGDNFVWIRDKITGTEIATSRGDSSFNFFDIGDLSYYSMYLVQQDLARISAATGVKIDRSLEKRSSIAVFHDTKVFSRLKNEKASFSALGIPDDIIEMLEQRVSDDTKCITMSVSDNKSDILFTVVLLSEKFDGCLAGGLLKSFGVVASDINIRALINACVLYEGRRLGLRDRQSLSQETPRLRELCLAKAFTRVLNILGFDRFTAYLAERASANLKRIITALIPALRSLPLALRRSCTDIALRLEVAMCRPIPAA